MFEGLLSRLTGKAIINKTNYNALSGALKNYVTAVRNLNNRTNIKKLEAIINTPANNPYRKRITNIISSIVSKTYKAENAAAAAAAGGAPQAPAVNAVNNLAAKLNELNTFMRNFKGGNANAMAAYYMNSGRNVAANRALNARRQGGPSYAGLFNNVNRRKTTAKNAAVKAVGNYIWNKRAWGGVGGMAVNTNYAKIAREIARKEKNKEQQNGIHV